MNLLPGACAAEFAFRLAHPRGAKGAWLALLHCRALEAGLQRRGLSVAFAVSMSFRSNPLCHPAAQRRDLHVCWLIQKPCYATTAQVFARGANGSASTVCAEVQGRTSRHADPSAALRDDKRSERRGSGYSPAVEPATARLQNRLQPGYRTGYSPALEPATKPATKSASGCKRIKEHLT